MTEKAEGEKPTENAKDKPLSQPTSEASATEPNNPGITSEAMAPSTADISPPSPAAGTTRLSFKHLRELWDGLTWRQKLAGYGSMAVAAIVFFTTIAPFLGVNPATFLNGQRPVIKGSELTQDGPSAYKLAVEDRSGTPIPADFQCFAKLDFGSRHTIILKPKRDCTDVRVTSDEVRAAAGSQEPLFKEKGTLSIGLIKTSDVGRPICSADPSKCTYTAGWWRVWLDDKPIFSEGRDFQMPDPAPPLELKDVANQAVVAASSDASPRPLTGTYRFSVQIASSVAQTYYDAHGCTWSLLQTAGTTKIIKEEFIEPNGRCVWKIDFAPVRGGIDEHYEVSLQSGTKTHPNQDQVAAASMKFIVVSPPKPVIQIRASGTRVLVPSEITFEAVALDGPNSQDLLKAVGCRWQLSADNAKLPNGPYRVPAGQTCQFTRSLYSADGEDSQSLQISVTAGAEDTGRDFGILDGVTEIEILDRKLKLDTVILPGGIDAILLVPQRQNASDEWTCSLETKSSAFNAEIAGKFWPCNFPFRRTGSLYHDELVTVQAKLAGEAARAAKLTKRLFFVDRTRLRVEFQVPDGASRLVQGGDLLRLRVTDDQGQLLPPALSCQFTVLINGVAQPSYDKKQPCDLAYVAPAVIGLDEQGELAIETKIVATQSDDDDLVAETILPTQRAMFDTTSGFVSFYILDASIAMHEEMPGAGKSYIQGSIDALKRSLPSLRENRALFAVTGFGAGVSQEPCGSPWVVYEPRSAPQPSELDAALNFESRIAAEGGNVEDAAKFSAAKAAAAAHELAAKKNIEQADIMVNLVLLARIDRFCPYTPGTSSEKRLASAIEHVADRLKGFRVGLQTQLNLSSKAKISGRSRSFVLFFGTDAQIGALAQDAALADRYFDDDPIIVPISTIQDLHETMKSVAALSDNRRKVRTEACRALGQKLENRNVANSQKRLLNSCGGG